MYVSGSREFWVFGAMNRMCVFEPVLVGHLKPSGNRAASDWGFELLEYPRMLSGCLKMSRSE